MSGTFSESYLGRLRARIGHDLVLVPGVQVVLVREDGRVLVQQRADNGTWEIPAGSCEPGQSFRTAAVAELREETGVTVTPDALVPFATISHPDYHLIVYPTGDQVHAFALCFWTEANGAEPVAVDGEATEFRWVRPDALPEPAHGPTRVALARYAEHRATGAFIAD